MRLFHAPLHSGLRILNVEAEGGKAVADKIRGRPVLFCLGLGAHLQKQVDGAAIGFERLLVATEVGGFGTHTQDVEEESLEESLQCIDIGRSGRCVAVGDTVNDSYRLKEVGDNNRSVKVVVEGVVAFLLKVSNLGGDGR